MLKERAALQGSPFSFSRDIKQSMVTCLWNFGNDKENTYKTF